MPIKGKKKVANYFDFLNKSFNRRIELWVLLAIEKKVKLKICILS